MKGTCAMPSPNILVLHCDQLRWDCLAFNGNPDISTPNLDRLARDSVNYCNQFTVYPICTPSRYSLWSGMYVHQHGAWDNMSTLPSGYPTFPGVLRDNGYRTVAVGKMHMNPTYQDVGFSEMTLAEQNGIGRFEDDYHRWLMDQGKIDRFDLHHQSGIFRQEGCSHRYDMCQCAQSDLAQEDYSTEWITRMAEQELHRWEDGTPSMLMVGYISPHHPFDPPAPYSSMYDPDKLTLLPGYLAEPLDRDNATNGTAMDYNALSEGDIRSIMAAYYAMISEIDAGIGRLIDLLKEKGLYDNTMIVFTSDHGEYMGFHHMMLKCNHLYDPLARVPLLVKYPGSEGAGQCDPALTENIDIAPTVLQACGLPTPATMQGRPLSAQPCREFVFSEGQYGTEEASCLGYMLRTDRFKLLVRGSLENAMLFDLEKDPAELQNVADDPAYRDTLTELQNKLAHFVMFDSLGKVYRHRAAPQLRRQADLDDQSARMKDFIRSQW